MSSEQYNFVLKIEMDGINASRILCMTLFDIDRLVSLTFTDRPGDNSISEAVEDFGGRRWPHYRPDVVFFEDASRALQPEDQRSSGNGHSRDGELYRPKGNSLDVWAREFGIQRRKFLGSPTWTPFVSQHWILRFTNAVTYFLGDSFRHDRIILGWRGCVMPRRSPYVIALTGEERGELEARAKSPSGDFMREYRAF